MPITTVVFDIGETLVDETRHWGEWADWLGVPRLTLFAVLGAVISRGEHHRWVFEILRPGFDMAAAEAERRAGGWRYGFEPQDLYPDAAPCIARLRELGYRVGLAGNQPQGAEAALAQAGLTADFIASSASWGVEKPSPAFFNRLIEAAGCPAGQIAYVGDRLDNDVLPARAAGMTAVFLRRGPWGVLQAGWPELDQAHRAIERLDQLIEALQGLGQAPSR